MRIPGLTFIIVPLICWIFYINADIIINFCIKFYNKTGIIGIILLIFFLCIFSLFYYGI
jgi:hypothetical protein